MIKTFNLDDEKFYNMLNPENFERLSPFKEVAKMNYIVPLVLITGVGMENSWYNSHIGETYEIFKYVVDTDTGYINFLVKSRGDGTKSGYKPMSSMQRPTKILDIVHSDSCKVTIGFKKRIMTSKIEKQTKI